MCELYHWVTQTLASTSAGTHLSAGNRHHQLFRSSGLRRESSMAHPLPPGVSPHARFGDYCNLADLLEDSFRHHGQRDLLDCITTRLRFPDGNELFEALGAWLQSPGFENGSQMAIIMPTVPHYLVTILVVFCAGYVSTNVNRLRSTRSRSISTIKGRYHRRQQSSHSLPSRCCSKYFAARLGTNPCRTKSRNISSTSFVRCRYNTSSRERSAP